MYSPFPIKLTQVYASGSFPCEPGFTIPLGNGKKIFKFVQYSDGDGNIPGLRGRICYRVGPYSGHLTGTQEQVTCDISSSSVPSEIEYAGVIQPDVVLDGEGCWTQIFGPGEVAMWATITAIDRISADVSDTMLSKYLVPAAAGNNNISGDGIVASALVQKDSAYHYSGIFAELLEDVSGAPTAADDRVLLAIDGGTTGAFIVGETVTGGTSADTCVIVERLRRGSTTYGLIVSTVTSTYFHTATETLTGGTSGATGTLTCKGEHVAANSYRLMPK